MQVAPMVIYSQKYNETDIRVTPSISLSNCTTHESDELLALQEQHTCPVIILTFTKQITNAYFYYKKASYTDILVAKFGKGKTVHKKICPRHLRLPLKVTYLSEHILVK
jgi:hypothetical protein